MPTYAFTCPNCGSYREVVRDIEDRTLPVDCQCGVSMERLYHGLPPMIQGDTVAGGCNYSGYDDSLGMSLTGRAQQREEMKKRDLVRYEPDPEMQKYRDEANYIRSHAPQGDRKAKQAAKKLQCEAGKHRRHRNVKEALKPIKREIERGT